MFAICRRVGAGGGLSIALGIRRAKDESAREQGAMIHMYVPATGRSTVLLSLSSLRLFLFVSAIISV